MKCAAAVESMLEADPSELARLGESELVEHISICAQCRSIADEILECQHELTLSLEQEKPRLAASEALRLAGQRASVLKRRNAVLQVGIPLAAAATLTGIVLLGGGRSGIEGVVLARVPEALPGLEVESPSGKDVAVFEVADRPDVVVVWFFQAGDD